MPCYVTVYTINLYLLCIQLGCCTEFAHLFGVLPNITKSTLESCNVTECLPLPFNLSPAQPCGGGSPTSSVPTPMITLSLVLLVVVQLF